MHYILKILPLLVLSCTVFAQNLVPNPDFELYNDCPNDGGQLDLVEDWYKIENSKGTPDFYHRCFDISTSLTNMGIPNNWNGYQEAKSGDAYVGIFTYGYDNTREYIQVELLEALEADKFYEFKMYVNTANRSGVAINGMGVYFSEEAIEGEDDYQPLDVDPHVINPIDEIMTDTADWTLINGYYTAEGGEKFITIGNYLTDSMTEATMFDIGGGSIQGYSYIDQVSLIQVDSIISDIGNYENLKEPTSYPNPSNNQFTIELNDYYNGNNQVSIYNLMGNKVIDSKTVNSNKIEMDISMLNQGIYMYYITDGKTVVYTGKIIKH